MKTAWRSKLSRVMTVMDVGRNDECPCGSKMKFKYCCIDKVQVPILRARPKSQVGLVKEFQRKVKRMEHNRKARFEQFGKRFRAKLARRAHNGR